MNSNKNIPFNIGIKEFKRLLKENKQLSDSEKHKAIKIYKQRAYGRIEQLKEQYSKMFESGVTEELTAIDNKDKV